MKILEKLFGLTESTDLDAALADLAAEREALEAKREELQAALRTAPFDDLSRVPELRQQLRQMDDDLEVVAGVVEETKKRAAAAAEAEEHSRVLAALEDGRKSRERLRSEGAALRSNIEAALKMVDRMEEHHRAVRAANGIAGIVSPVQDRSNRYTPMRIHSPDFNFTNLRSQLIGLLQQVPEMHEPRKSVPVLQAAE